MLARGALRPCAGATPRLEPAAELRLGADRLERPAARPDPRPSPTRVERLLGLRLACEGALSAAGDRLDGGDAGARLDGAGRVPSRRASRAGATPPIVPEGRDDLSAVLDP